MSIERLKVSFNIIQEFTKEQKEEAIQKCISDGIRNFGGFDLFEKCNHYGITLDPDRIIFKAKAYHPETDELEVEWFGRVPPDQYVGSSSELIVTPLYYHRGTEITSCAGFQLQYRTLFNEEVVGIIQKTIELPNVTKDTVVCIDHTTALALLTNYFLVAGRIFSETAHKETPKFFGIFYNSVKTDSGAEYRVVHVAECDEEGYYIDESPESKHYPFEMLTGIHATSIKFHGVRTRIEVKCEDVEDLKEEIREECLGEVAPK